MSAPLRQSREFPPCMDSLISITEDELRTVICQAAYEFTVRFRGDDEWVEEAFEAFYQGVRDALQDREWEDKIPPARLRRGDC